MGTFFGKFSSASQYVHRTQKVIMRLVYVCTYVCTYCTMLQNDLVLVSPTCTYEHMYVHICHV
jgi:hypothetical protein